MKNHAKVPSKFEKKYSYILNAIETLDMKVKTFKKSKFPALRLPSLSPNTTPKKKLRKKRSFNEIENSSEE